MPVLLWRHRCLDGYAVRKDPWCPVCSERSVVAGMAFDVHQSMAVYQYVYGLKPVGLHRLLTERLFFGMRDRCERCKGGGVIGDWERAWWRLCPECEGTGGFWNRPDDEIEATRLRVLEEHPDAEVRDAPSDFASDRLRFKMAINTVVKIRDRGTEAAARTHQTAMSAWQEVDEQNSAFDAARTMRTIRPRPQPGYTNRGVCLAKVGAAFVVARRSFGKDAKWKVKGNGHCRRVSLAPLCTARAKHAVDCWEPVCIRHLGRYIDLFPLEFVEKAAEILGVHAHALIGDEY